MPNPVINRRAPGVATRSGPVEDPDIAAWVARVVANGSNVSAATRGYANTFLTTIKSSGVRSKILRLNLHAGDGVLAATAPLIIDQGSTVDGIVGSAAGLTYAETGVTGGIKSAGSTVVDTSFNPSTMASGANDFSMGCYMHTATNAGDACMGCSNTDETYIFVNNVGTTYWEAYTVATRISAADAIGTGFYIGNRPASNNLTIYRNNVSLATTATNSGSLPNETIGIHCYKVTGVGYIAITLRIFAGYFIGKGLNSAERQSLGDAFQTFNASLSRSV